MKLAIYDLDRTITRRPTWSLFLLHAARRLAPWRLALVPLLVPVALAKAAGAIDRDAMKVAMHRLLLGRAVPAGRLAAVAESFATAFAETDILPGARARIDADRAAGWRIVIATAAHRFYAAPLARAIGADALIATEARTEADTVLSLLDGANCYGPAKLAAIRAWMAKEGIARADATVRFYSDHVSDEPSFTFADDPVAVNAHMPLQDLAASRGWRTLDWR